MDRDGDALSRACGACGAEPEEECRPMCLGEALRDDEYRAGAVDAALASMNLTRHAAYRIDVNVSVVELVVDAVLEYVETQKER